MMSLGGSKGDVYITLLALLYFCVWQSGLVERYFGVAGLRSNGDPHVIDYSEYYYRDLTSKLTESMSINNCSLNGHGLSFLPPDSGDLVMEEFDLSVELVHPNDAVKASRGTLNKEKYIEDRKLFLQVSPNICRSKGWTKFKKGETFKGSRGCSEKFVGQKVGINDKRVFTLHPGHVRCDVGAALSACSSGSSGPMPVRRKDRTLHNYPFAITANKGALIAPSGHIVNSCGVFGLFASCEAIRLGLPPAEVLVDQVINCQKAHAADRSLEKVQETYVCPYPRIDRVFVMSQFDDIKPDRFLTETLPRLTYHLDYVLANFNVAIHIGFPSRPLDPKVLSYLDWLGLTSRIVNGTVYADEAYMPREGGCQDASYNAWEIINQRETFLKLATHVPAKKTIHNDIINRFARYDFEAEKGKPFIIFVKGPESFASYNRQIEDALRMHVSTALQQYDFHVYPSSNSSLHSCPPCDVRLFSRAALVVGAPQADLSNMMFMKFGGTAVETVLTSLFDPKVAPVIGINTRLAAVVGLHHFTYGIDGSFQEQQFIQDVLTFHGKVNLWH